MVALRPDGPGRRAGGRHRKCHPPSRLIIPPRPEIITEAGQLVPVQGRELLEGGGALLGQGQPDDPPVIGVFLADDQPGGLGPLGQLDGTVVAKQQIAGHVADSWPARVVMPPHREQQLVLGGGKPGRLGLRLAPVQKPAQARTQDQQPPVIGISE